MIDTKSREDYSHETHCSKGDCRCGRSEEDYDINERSAAKTLAAKKRRPNRAKNTPAAEMTTLLGARRTTMSPPPAKSVD